MPPLETVRRRKPMTQRELAEAAGVSESTIRAIEAGRSRRIHPRVMRAIAGALGVEPAAVAEFRPALGLDPEAEQGKALAA
jgi:transcriptional regulator with XRE-family HTH domain